ncbi:MarR family winged helix-turn-helix transcriptional regulator [Streptomyces sp. NPDC001185]|uniref:MarR family winged helix-turn-helix transcriptional regulator n=1 Tax=Streptomyces sp. NPDC001185 TaxID=3154380 RepID=UPI00332392FA
MDGQTPEGRDGGPPRGPHDGSPRGTDEDTGSPRGPDAEPGGGPPGGPGSDGGHGGGERGGAHDEGEDGGPFRGPDEIFLPVRDESTVPVAEEGLLRPAPDESFLPTPGGHLPLTAEGRFPPTVGESSVPGGDGHLSRTADEDSPPAPDGSFLPGPDGRAPRAPAADTALPRVRDDVLLRAADQLAAVAEVLVSVSARTAVAVDGRLSPSLLRALSLVGASPGLSLAALADRARISRSRASRVCDTLEDAGLLARVPLAADRRGVGLSLTRHGRSVLGRVRERRDDWIRDALLRMPDADLDGLLSALRSLGPSLADGYQALPGPGHPV